MEAVGGGLEGRLEVGDGARPVAGGQVDHAAGVEVFRDRPLEPDGVVDQVEGLGPLAGLEQHDQPGEVVGGDPVAIVELDGGRGTAPRPWDNRPAARRGCPARAGTASIAASRRRPARARRGRGRACTSSRGAWGLPTISMHTAATRSRRAGSAQRDSQRSRASLTRPRRARNPASGNWFGSAGGWAATRPVDRLGRIEQAELLGQARQARSGPRTVRSGRSAKSRIRALAASSWLSALSISASRNTSAIAWLAGST